MLSSLRAGSGAERLSGPRFGRPLPCLGVAHAERVRSAYPCREQNGAAAREGMHTFGRPEAGVRVPIRSFSMHGRSGPQRRVRPRAGARPICAGRRVCDSPHGPLVLLPQTVGARRARHREDTQRCSGSFGLDRKGDGSTHRC